MKTYTVTVLRRGEVNLYFAVSANNFDEADEEARIACAEHGFEYDDFEIEEQP